MEFGEEKKEWPKVLKVKLKESVKMTPLLIIFGLSLGSFGESITLQTDYQTEEKYETKDVFLALTDLMEVIREIYKNPW